MADTTLTHKNGATPALAGTENAYTKKTISAPIQQLKPNNPFDLFSDRITSTPAYQYMYSNNIKSTAKIQQTDPTGQVKLGNTPNAVNVHAHTIPGQKQNTDPTGQVQINAPAAPATVTAAIAATPKQVTPPVKTPSTTANPSIIDKIKALVTPSEKADQTTNTGTKTTLTPSNELMTADHKAAAQPDTKTILIIAAVLAGLYIITK